MLSLQICFQRLKNEKRAKMYVLPVTDFQKTFISLKKVQRRDAV